MVQLGKIKEAISVYEKLNARYPTNPTWYFRLIDLWQQENKPQEVLRTIAQVEKIIGVTEETTRQKQVIYLQQNQVEKIFQASDALIASEPKEIEFVLQKAQMQMAANRWEDASRTLQNLIAQHPSASKAYSLLISIAVIQEDDKMLAQWIRQILPQRNISLSDVSPFLRQALAAQKIEESEQLYTLLKTRIEPANTPAVEYSLAGFWALSIERWSEAQTFLQKSLDLDPNDLSNWQALMEADKQMSALDVLIQHADQATTYFPAEPSFWYQLGWGLYYQKKNQEALEALQEVLRIPSASKTQKAYSHALIGDIYHAMKRFGPSDQAYDAALTLDPTLAQALNNFSYFSALRKENLELAEVRAKKLIDLYPNIPGYLDTYAWVLVQQGKWDQALPWLEKAVSIESGVSATVWEHLGDVYDFLKLPEKAKIAWEKARSLGGNTSQLNQKLAQ